jgi:predicted DCC family thiol-disulfide oxidoreductase YuxK
MEIFPSHLVLYDGSCGFCNRSVQFILKNEESNTLFFAAIQSETAKKLFESMSIKKPDLNTFYFYSNGVLYKRSSAAILVSKFLKKPYRFIGFFSWVPTFLRDRIYRIIAKNRHRLAKEYCYIPQKEQKERFLV